MVDAVFFNLGLGLLNGLALSVRLNELPRSHLIEARRFHMRLP